ncbi:fructokinase-1-like [Pyrus ussuriensis x Pyrus communis]|uniref:Fructokinase-1-like n=1 Tax=Pyrus ussuriensis x Pyrus communis TaxID=2448454 RepID=A0A5N5I0J4_9ROSA|nr:fructokinase-1-like [Pyrus ussuriensis x Pyrus communis]
MANNLAPTLDKKLVLHEDSKDASSHKKRGSQDDKSLVVCFGEMLIDFVPIVAQVLLAEAPAFKKALGGAPANVAVGVARLGGSAGFIGNKTDSSTFAFWSKSSMDIEPRHIRLQSNSYTANTLLDTVIAATIHVPDEAITKYTACGSDFGAL